MLDPFYVNKLYPLQDAVLKSIGSINNDFYLTGGTALSRLYLKHRYSDDLDFFVNRSANFKQQVNIILDCLKRDKLIFQTGAISDEFLRILIRNEDVILKIDFVNDVEAHFGSLKNCEALFPRIDSWQNILSNKICALSRLEPKDFVDIFFIAMKYSFDWEQIINEAREKDLWVEPIAVSRLIRTFSDKKLQAIKWRKPSSETKILKIAEIISDDILNAHANSVLSLSALTNDHGIP